MGFLGDVIADAKTGLGGRLATVPAPVALPNGALSETEPFVAGKDGEGGVPEPELGGESQPVDAWESLPQEEAKVTTPGAAAALPRQEHAARERTCMEEREGLLINTTEKEAGGDEGNEMIAARVAVPGSGDSPGETLNHEPLRMGSSGVVETEEPVSSRSENLEFANESEDKAVLSEGKAIIAEEELSSDGSTDLLNVTREKNATVGNSDETAKRSMSSDGPRENGAGAIFDRVPKTPSGGHPSSPSVSRQSGGGGEVFSSPSPSAPAPLLGRASSDAGAEVLDRVAGESSSSSRQKVLKTALTGGSSGVEPLPPLETRSAGVLPEQGRRKVGARQDDSETDYPRRTAEDAEPRGIAPLFPPVQEATSPSESPRVTIGQIDVVVQTPAPAPKAQLRSGEASSAGFASRHYLRRL